MSNSYTVVEADLTPVLVPSDEYALLLARPSTGLADTTLADLITAADAEIASHMGGTPTLAANLALVKPQALAVLIYRMHARRAANADYTVPESVTAAWKAAIQWAQTIGARLLAAEGTTQPAGTDQVQYEAPDATHTMTHLDYL